jgi:hypothetical protein
MSQVQHHGEGTMILQQDGASPRFYIAVRACREAMSTGKWIGRGEYLAFYRPSPDVTPLDSRRM